MRPALLYPVETLTLMERLEGLLASCDHRMLRYMSTVRWQGRITDEELEEDLGWRTLNIG